jgi:hypothetical protein
VCAGSEIVKEMKRSAKESKEKRSRFKPVRTLASLKNTGAWGCGTVMCTSELATMPTGLGRTDIGTVHLSTSGGVMRILVVFSKTEYALRVREGNCWPNGKVVLPENETEALRPPGSARMRQQREEHAGDN